MRPKKVITTTKAYRELATRFKSHLLKMGYDPKSCQSRYGYITEFLHYLEQKGFWEITQITSKEIQDYYKYISSRPSLNSGTNLSQKTTSTHLHNVRDLFTMLQEEKRIEVNPCGVLKFTYPKSNKPKIVLTQLEILELYEAATDYQERAILSLAYGCGLRVGELTKCNIEDVKLRDKILIVPDGKGRKRRVVPMSAGVVNDLAEYYYKERIELTLQIGYRSHIGNARAFMLNSLGRRMQAWTYNKHLKKIIEQTKNKTIINKQITVHSLRHAIATHLIEKGVEVEQVRLFLGHSQLETTQIYTHVSQQQLADLLTPKKKNEDETTENTKEIPP